MYNRYACDLISFITNCVLFNFTTNLIQSLFFYVYQYKNRLNYRYNFCNVFEFGVVRFEGDELTEILLYHIKLPTT